ncbi:MAG: threonylcarbamoyl-AMP synthase [Methanobrevibacter sp.]|uniref:L-threonylcarbamoyladenylate synthase n=1 Tax=Methanobrevibacter millerae TaxID=230361 RepID=A0A8T3VD85_9EURY|nr:L-threonylcarbamoyladenylate synthase [Methanobrevibacter millerae]MBE6505132.1 threonylcarbamoyl-AMP synthase [Methanobrevibacter millerae]MBR0059123.1 threonylcarbamoyl-AMP synthase [Methanobrevibacter sp.]
MKILKTSNTSPDEKVINEAIDVLADGGVIIYPTDTVYGLGADIFNNKAVRRVFKIKQRNLLKPLSILVSNTDAIEVVAKISRYQKNALDKYLPGPYTFILNKKPIVPRVVTGGLTHVGVRVPENEIACKLAGIFPITTTSANLSDEEVLSTPDEILEQLGCDVDLVIDVGPLESKNASTIVDLTAPQPTFIRR